VSKKTFEITDTKAIRVEAVEVQSRKGISIRQLYKTKKTVDWQYAKQGIILPLEQAEAIAKMVAKFATSDATSFKTLEFNKE